MLSTTNLAKAYGARTLFEGVSLHLNEASRYGLVGANGSGKTTFLKILAGDEPASAGAVSLPRRARVGVLRQDRFENDEIPILDAAMMGDRLVWDALTEQRRITEGEPTRAADAERLAELEDVIRAHDGYTLEARATAILEGLGIPLASHRRPLATLSGGFKLRVLLAQVLLGGPDVLLLDEPTNHLDILSIRWLEKFLAAYTGCAVVISHDQRFVDNIATDILDVDYGTITPYVGNYSAFVVEKQANRARKEAEIASAEEAIAHKKAYVDRFRYKATKARQAQSRLKQIERLEEDMDELADTSRRSPSFRFTQDRPSGRDVLAIEGVSKAYGEKRVLSSVSLAVRRGEKIGIIGANGLGKSTLLRIAVGRLEADAGEARWGHEARVGYFPQDHHELLDDPEETPLHVIRALCPDASETFVRGELGRALFTGEQVHRPVFALSGGEAARLIFCRLMVERPNVLVLDEPTNHLDLEAISALVAALRDFEGAVLFVSHDRFFVSELATRIIEVTPLGLRDFPGTYAEYLERCGDDHLDADAVLRKTKAEKKPVAAAPTGVDWEAQKRERNRKKELPARRDKVMAELEAKEARKKAIVELYCTEGFFERTPKAEIAALEAEQAALGARIDALMAEWEELETAIAEGG